MYEQNALAQSAQQTPVLGQLKCASERVAKATVVVAEFVNRFHGPSPEQSAAARNEVAPAQTYRNDIETLFAQLDRLEYVIASLSTIG